MESTEVQLLLSTIETIRVDMRAMEKRLLTQFESIRPLCDSNSARIGTLETDQAVRQAKARLAGVVLGFLSACGGAIITVVGRYVLGG